MNSSGVPTSPMTVATNEYTGGISTATRGTSAKVARGKAVSNGSAKYVKRYGMGAPDETGVSERDKEGHSSIACLYIYVIT